MLLAQHTWPPASAAAADQAEQRQCHQQQQEQQLFRQQDSCSKQHCSKSKASGSFKIQCSSQEHKDQQEPQHGQNGCSSVASGLVHTDALTVGAHTTLSVHTQLHSELRRWLLSSGMLPALAGLVVRRPEQLGADSDDDGLDAAAAADDSAPSSAHWGSAGQGGSGGGQSFREGGSMGTDKVNATTVKAGSREGGAGVPSKLPAAGAAIKAALATGAMSNRGLNTGGDADASLLQLGQQSVAAACQYLAASDEPLHAAHVQLLLDYLWDSCCSCTGCSSGISSSLSSSTPPTTKAPARASATAGSSSSAVSNNCSSSSSSSSAVASSAVAVVWGLAQHAASRQQLLMDGRWARILSHCLASSYQRLQKASPGGLPPAATISTQASTVASSVGAGGKARSAAAAAGRSGSSSSSGGGGGGLGVTAGAKVAEAHQVMQLGVQAAWLLLQESVEQLLALEEVPYRLQHVYKKDYATWWGVKVDADR